MFSTQDLDSETIISSIVQIPLDTYLCNSEITLSLFLNDSSAYQNQAALAMAVAISSTASAHA